jgi:hypothetical protein
MEDQQRKMERFFFLGLIFIFCNICQGAALGSSLSLVVKDSLVDLKAEDIPLIDVLKAISAKTELAIKSDETLTESILCDFKKTSLEEVIQQLLKNRNYVMVYRERGNKPFLLSELWIVSGGNSHNPLLSSLPENHAKSYEKEWFKREFDDEDRLLKSISTSPSILMPGSEGILITRVAEDSPFQKLGLKEGDRIHDVNGQPIATVTDFIQALKSVSSNPQSLLMIGLRRSDNSSHPIYVHFH